jgi:hypothetical protein
MKQHWLLFTLLFTLSFQSFATSQAVLEETLYYDFQKVILDKNFAEKGMLGFSAFEQGLFVDALWDLVEEKSPEALEALDQLPIVQYNLYEKLRIGILRLKYRNAEKLPDDLVVELENALREPNTDLRIVYNLAAYEDEILAAGHTEHIHLATTHQENI